MGSCTEMPTFLLLDVAPGETDVTARVATASPRKHSMRPEGMDTHARLRSEGDEGQDVTLLLLCMFWEHGEVGFRVATDS